MKKFALIARVGRWNDKNGRMVINCTVERFELVAEADTRGELVCPSHMEYKADGTWRTYWIESRANAKRMLGLAR